MAPQREWFEKDYYQVLGVSDTASQKDIKSAYRKLSRQYHPDANPGDTAAEERFKEVSAAYDVVGDAEQAQGVRRGPPARARWAACSAAPAARAAARCRRFRFEDVGDLGDLLGGLFGRGRRRGAAGRSGPGHRAPPRARTSRPSCTSTSRTPSQGVDHHDPPHERRRLLDLPRHRRPARHDAARVPAVPGPRRDRRQPGLLLLLASRAPTAPGQGYLIDDPCPTCRGTGIERRPREVKVRIPAGVARRPAHPAEGPGRPRSQRRPARRPLRDRPRRPPTRCSAAGATTSR